MEKGGIWLREFLELGSCIFLARVVRKVLPFGCGFLQLDDGSGEMEWI